ncbi:hypothetical protein VTI74DRAFT_7846 [Chaetomium olivicolor]
MACKRSLRAGLVLLGRHKEPCNKYLMCPEKERVIDSVSLGHACPKCCSSGTVSSPWLWDTDLKVYLSNGNTEVFV